MARQQYTLDSLTRALDHHVSTGAIGFYQRAAETKDGWRVELPSLGVVTFTTAQLAGLTQGLAAGERRWKGQASA